MMTIDSDPICQQWMNCKWECAFQLIWFLTPTDLIPCVNEVGWNLWSYFKSACYHIQAPKSEQNVHIVNAFWKLYKPLFENGPVWFISCSTYQVFYIARWYWLNNTEYEQTTHVTVTTRGLQLISNGGTWKVVDAPKSFFRFTDIFLVASDSVLGSNGTNLFGFDNSTD